MATQITKNITADVTKRGSTKAIYAKQSDLNSRFLNVRIQEEGKDIVVSPGTTVILNVERSDNAEKMFYGSVNEDGTVSVQMSSWMLELPGNLLCDVSLITEDPNGVKLTTMQFTVFVEAATVADGDVTDTREYSVIVDLLSRTTAAESRAINAADRAEYLRAQCEAATREAHDVVVDADAMMQRLYDTITAELAARGQIRPDFANNIAECVDTNKLYVLPDGYVYAYGYRVDNMIPNFANKADPLSTDWKDSYRINSSGVLIETPGYITTNFIACRPNDVIRVKGLDMRANAYPRFVIYDSAKRPIAHMQPHDSSLNNNYACKLKCTLDENGVFTYQIAYDNNGGQQATDTTTYVRLVGGYDPDYNEVLITINQEITYSAGGSYAWRSTGHSFVSSENVVVLPTYTKVEADSVIDRVIAAQGNRTFTFAAISDMHYGFDNKLDSIIHACQAMRYIDQSIKLDAVAVLGDYTDGYPASAYADAVADFKAINKILTELRFGQNFRIPGNHDYYADHLGETNRFISAYSDDVVWGNVPGGYFYKDLEGYKLRVICVNTTETGNGENRIHVSNAQYNWFANALDLSSKADASEWKILVLSHHPLDWWADEYVFAYVLNAYKSGATWTNGTISVDYLGKNAATLIGNIHGHIHNFVTDYIHLGNVSVGNKSTIIRMSTPNACSGRENQYTAEVAGVNTWVEDTTYPKTPGTAKDTAFCVYCVDLDANTIKAICHGAGYDRAVTY